MVSTLKKGATRKDINLILKKMLLNKGKSINLKKYFGKLNFQDDPLIIQKDLRNEWE